MLVASRAAAKRASRVNAAQGFTRAVSSQTARWSETTSVTRVATRRFASAIPSRSFAPPNPGRGFATTADAAKAGAKPDDAGEEAEAGATAAAAAAVAAPAAAAVVEAAPQVVKKESRWGRYDVLLSDCDQVSGVFDR